MRSLLLAATVAVAVVLSAACAPGGGGTPGQPEQPGAEEELDSVTAEPAVELEGSCEPLPQRDDDGHFVSADLVARNAGNIGVIARVVAAWRQPGGSRVVASKRVRLELDQSEPVQLRIDIGAREARAIRRMVERDRPCITRVSVGGAFGAPRE